MELAPPRPVEQAPLPGAAEAPPRRRAAFPAHRYFLILAVFGLFAAFVLPITYAVDAIGVGLLLVGLPVAGLVLWRPEFGLYVIVLYVPFEYFGIIGGDVATLTKVIGIFTVVALLMHLVATGRWEVRSVGLWLALAFAGWSTLSVIGTFDPAYAWNRALTRIQMVGLVFVVLNACWTREQTRALLIALFLAAVLAAIGALVLPQPIEETAGIRRTLGTQGTNAHAKDLLPGLLLLPWIVSVTARRWLKALVVLGAFVVLVDLVWTGSRSNYAALLAGVVVGVLAYSRISLARRVRLVVAVVLILGVVIGLVALTGIWEERLWERVEWIWERGLGEGGRLELWSHAIAMGFEHPFMGVGVGQFGYALLTRLSFKAGAMAVHNDLLTHFAETGIPGLLLYLGFLVAVAASVWCTASLKLRSCVLALVVAAFVASMANPSYALKSWWLAMGLGLLIGRRFRSPPAPEQSHECLTGRRNARAVTLGTNPDIVSRRARS